jgi:hypothetical protein
MTKLKLEETLELLNALFSEKPKQSMLKSFSIISLEKEDAEKYQKILGRYYLSQLNGPSIENDVLKKQPFYSVIVFSTKQLSFNN